MKLVEFDFKMCENMRQQILSDFGNPTLKEKVLDLIAQLEKDQAVILESA